MRPNAAFHRPDPQYLRMLIGIAGLTQKTAAERIGIHERTMRQYLADRNAATALVAPYPVQYCLEQLAQDLKPR